MRVVVVTGASSGIGRAAALALARRGFAVIATVRRADDGAALAAAAGAIGVGALVEPAELDVADSAAVRDFAAVVGEALRRRGGRLVGLVNNAGVVAAGPIEEVSLTRLRQALEVNVVGAIAVTQALLPLLRAGRGRIVNVSSVSGRMVSPFLGPYAASKFALEAVSDALRLELRPWGIATVVVEPGPVATPIWEKAAEAAFADRAGLAASPYAPLVPAVAASVRRAAKAGMPAEAVAETICRALTVRRPRARYLLTRRPWQFTLLHRFVPDRWRDALIWWALRRERARVREWR